MGGREPPLTEVLHILEEGTAYSMGTLMCANCIYPQHTRILLCAFLMKNISYLNEAVELRNLYKNPLVHRGIGQGSRRVCGLWGLAGEALSSPTTLVPNRTAQLGQGQGPGLSCQQDKKAGVGGTEGPSGTQGDADGASFSFHFSFLLSFFLPLFLRSLR